MTNEANAYKIIIKFLERNSNKQDKQQWIKTIKVHDNVYGVKLSKINPMIARWTKYTNFKDIENLWNDGKTESRIIAAKLLWKLGRDNPNIAFNLIKKFSKGLNDWATTDTLATQGIRGIIKEKEHEIKDLALDCIKNKNVWVKRFGIVIFINFPKDKGVKSIIKDLKNEKEEYIRKAVKWLERKSAIK